MNFMIEDVHSYRFIDVKGEGHRAFASNSLKYVLGRLYKEIFMKALEVFSTIPQFMS